MISITIKTNNIRKTVNIDVESTPREVLASVGFTGTTHNTFYLTGEALDEAELDATFSTLGVEDGDDVTLSSVVKGDGGSSN